MSELLDNILKVQEATGCTVLEGKKYLEQADGDIDLAIMIAKEDMAKPKAQPAPQPQPQPQYQQPQYGPQPQYQQPYGPQGYGPYQQPYQPRPRNPQQSAKTMKIIRMSLYGTAAAFSFAAIMMFFLDFISFTIWGATAHATGFGLLANQDATKDNPSIFVLLVPIFFYVAALIGSLTSLPSAHRRNMGGIAFAALALVAGIICFFAVQITGVYGRGCDLGAGAIGAGVFGILAAISVAVAGVLPNFGAAPTNQYRGY